MKYTEGQLMMLFHRGKYVVGRMSYSEKENFWFFAQNHFNGITRFPYDANKYGYKYFMCGYDSSIQALDETTGLYPEVDDIVTHPSGTKYEVVDCFENTCAIQKIDSPEYPQLITYKGLKVYEWKHLLSLRGGKKEPETIDIIVNGKTTTISKESAKALNLI